MTTEQSRHDTISLRNMSSKPSAKFLPRNSPCAARAIDRHARDQCPATRCPLESVGRWLEQHEAVEFLSLETRRWNGGTPERPLCTGSP
eukprot:611369-Pyramimonas_sp.AAC.1